MDWFLLREDERVLLLGEGNFSFSVSLVDLNHRPGLRFNNFYSTCYETGIDCLDTINNINKIKSHGFNVVEGVDATKLSQNPDIGFIEFDKIVFNFPHIKGKMKINLNRDLIREFFISSACLLAQGGIVAVALCSGQGGTQYEKSPRKWENTWQVVEMAAHADYTLTSVHPFPNEKFPQYVSSGFRGKSKSFNTCDALVHIFSRATPPMMSLDEPTLTKLISYHNLPNHSNLEVPFIHSKMFNTNPFDNDTPQNYFKTLLISCSEHIQNKCISRDLPFTVTNTHNTHVKCKQNRGEAFLRKSLDEVLPDLLPENNYIYSGVVFRRLTSDFSLCPVKCECVIIGDLVEDICQSFLTRLKEIFSEVEFSWILDESSTVKRLVCTNVLKEEKDLLQLTNFRQNERIFNICYVDLDEISLYLLRLESWKQLWSRDLLFTSKPELSFKVPCSTSQAYSFDINFMTTPQFDLEGFINLLWQIGDNIICAILLLNTYKHSDNDNISNCYRIVYKSYDKPLFRKRIVQFHDNVIGKCLQLLYNVVIC